MSDLPSEANWSLRAAGPPDLEPLLALATAFYAEDGFTTSAPDLRRNLLVLLSSSEARTAVVDRDGQLVAFAITTSSFGLENGQIAELEDLYVAPGQRRHGHAGRLISDSAAWARLRGCSHLELVVAPQGHDVTHLHDFYRAHGFGDDGRRLLSRPL